MPPRINPLKLNPLQFKTLALLQIAAQEPELGEILAETGEARLTRLPHAHGDHFHIGDKLLSGADATGLNNRAVFVALERKGLIRGEQQALVITKEGMQYDTSTAGLHIHAGDH